MRLENKVALITGAGSVGPGWGNGKATAVTFAREGASIFASDLVSEAVAETQSIITSEGGVCETHICDVTVTAQIEAMVEACVTRFGRIDILINNVGGSVPGGPVELSEEAWRGQLDFNLTHAFLACKYALPHMERQGSGAIVNISSIAGVLGNGSSIAYAGSKAAVNTMTLSLARALAPEIRVNAVCPGPIDTPMLRIFVARPDQQSTHGMDKEELVAKRGGVGPMGRPGKPEEVANAALFLLSDEASFVNGIAMPVDGGITA